MKKQILLLFLLYSIVAFSQKKEMVDNFWKGNYDKTIEIGKQILQSEPNDFETILLIARAEDEKGNFKNAIPYLESAKKMMSEDWQKSWAFIELAKIIKPMNPGSMTLFVTHGIFRNGTDCLFEAGFDRVITTDSLPQTQQNHKGEFHVFKI